VDEALSTQHPSLQRYCRQCSVAALSALTRCSWVFNRS
jgi:hypothetical protein